MRQKKFCTFLVCTYFAAVLAVVVLGGLEYGQVELRHGLRGDVRVPLGQVVDQHSAALEAQQALVALVDEPMVVGGSNLRVNLEFGFRMIYEKLEITFGTNFAAFA